MRIIKRNLLAGRLNFFEKRYAFTLAEVLITLGIVGVVASLTISALMKNWQDLQFKSAWKKNYSVFNQATINIMQENGGSMAGLTCTEVSDKVNCLNNKYKKQLSTIKTCVWGSGWRNCFHWPISNYYETVKWLNGTSHIPINTYPFSCEGSAGLVLKDGTLVLTNYQDPTCSSNAATGATVEGLTNGCGWITVDVNGFSAPNTVGKDIYIMLMLENGLKPAGVGTLKNTCTPTGDGRGCSAKYLYN